MTTSFHSAATQFLRARHHSKRRRRWVGVKGSTRNGCRDPKCPLDRHLRIVREDAGAPSEILFAHTPAVENSLRRDPTIASSIEEPQLSKMDGDSPDSIDLPDDMIFTETENELDESRSPSLRITLLPSTS
ncbi:uncharacterized protein TNCV_4694021 [Trichonephila clavipes]|uniref:Uncharacterized protein n=1 Tax=Trichonephila clavipes TaxID=2585209 RepID=A0A8X6WB06_TRICX|nr:uncharacterized protein TNCV_4694021 [Trichonephila clavipes]